MAAALGFDPPSVRLDARRLSLRDETNRAQDAARIVRRIRPANDKVVTRLEEATRIGKGGTLAAQLSRLDPIVLDELGYLPFARSGGQLLFPLISKLYERPTAIIPPNLDFDEYPTCFRHHQLHPPPPQ